MFLVSEDIIFKTVNLCIKFSIYNSVSSKEKCPIFFTRLFL